MVTLVSVSIRTQPGVRADRWTAVAWSLLGNLMILVGALWFGWPAGNLYLLFWVENVILGAVTLTKLLTVRSAEPARAGFFVVHYGLFCFVHLVFILVLAFANGLAPTFLAFGLPVILLVVRYAADLWTGWFAGDQRDRVSVGQVFASPYGRVFVLHFATILGFGYTITTGFNGAFPSSGATRPAWLGWLDRVRESLAAGGFALTNAMVVAVILVLVKTLFDLWLAGRTVTLGASSA